MYRGKNAKHNAFRCHKGRMAWVAGTESFNLFASLVSPVSRVLICIIRLLYVVVGYGMWFLMWTPSTDIPSAFVLEVQQ